MKRGLSELRTPARRAAPWRVLSAALALAGLLAVLAGTGLAQTTRRAGQFEDQPVRSVQPARPAPEDSAGTAASSAEVNAAPPVSSIRFDWPRVALALGIVLGLILLLRFVGQRWLALPGASGAGKVIRVLGRVNVTPRQGIVLLQVGRRIVVAAESGGAGGAMTTLCQITEPDEVASLLAQLEQATSTSVAGPAFGRWFKRAEEEFDEAPVPAGAMVAGRAAPGSSATLDADEEESAAIESARGELAGLLDKVRGLAGQFRRRT